MWFRCPFSKLADREDGSHALVRVDNGAVHGGSGRYLAGRGCAACVVLGVGGSGCGVVSDPALRENPWVRRLSGGTVLLLIGLLLLVIGGLIAAWQRAWLVVVLIAVGILLVVLDSGVHVSK